MQGARGCSAASSCIMEEYLTGELAEEQSSSRQRAAVLLDQLASGVETTNLPNPDELGDTALDALKLLDIAAVRADLVPELPIWGHTSDVAISACGDALVMRSGTAVAIIDWKSDIRSDSHSHSHSHSQHVVQVRRYMKLAGARRGAIVYMTQRRVVWVEGAEPQSLPDGT
ncbi:MAG: hypothetical protein GY788_10295 [bacterium]|nr:hypothetical protein [bacterium]